MLLTKRTCNKKHKAAAVPGPVRRRHRRCVPEPRLRPASPAWATRLAGGGAGEPGVGSQGGEGPAAAWTQHLPHADRWPVPWAAPPVSLLSTVGGPLLAHRPGPGHWPCSGLSWPAGATRTISQHWGHYCPPVPRRGRHWPSCLEGLPGSGGLLLAPPAAAGPLPPRGRPYPTHLGGAGLLSTQPPHATPPPRAQAAGSCGRHLPLPGGRVLLVAAPLLLGPLWQMPHPAEQSCSGEGPEVGGYLPASSGGRPFPFAVAPLPQTPAGVGTM